MMFLSIDHSELTKRSHFNSQKVEHNQEDECTISQGHLRARMCVIATNHLAVSLCETNDDGDHPYA